MSVCCVSSYSARKPPEELDVTTAAAERGRVGSAAEGTVEDLWTKRRGRQGSQRGQRRSWRWAFHRSNSASKRKQGVNAAAPSADVAVVGAPRTKRRGQRARRAVRTRLLRSELRSRRERVHVDFTPVGRPERFRGCNDGRAPGSTHGTGEECC